MQYGMHAPTIIHDPSKGRQTEKKVMDGIIHSAMLTSFQRSSIDGIITSAVPSHEKKKGGKESSKPLVSKVKASKTPQDIGMRHYQGSKYA